ncbi:MAG TPA: hypothetical protein VMP08_00950 [Anaerolineae bacterium]|nr:hypothetical protein [Anaerolineae bacterium]
MNRDQLARSNVVSRSGRDIGALLIILTIWVLFFSPLFTPVVTDRVQLASGDFTLQFLAFRRFGLSELQQGRWPLWMPCVDSGYPYFADPQAASFYPPALLNYAGHLISGATEFSLAALQLEAVLHVLLAAITAYAFLCGEVRSRWAALIGALAFGFGGYLLSFPMLQLAILETAAWLPAILWTLRRAATRADKRSIALAGAVFALCALAGHPQTLVMIAYVAVAYFAFSVWRAHMRLRRAVLSLAAISVLALLLSAIQWVPTLEFMRLSSRAELTVETAGTGFAFSDVMQLIAPGRVSQYSPLYIGLLSLALALSAFGATVAKRIKGEVSARVWFWGIVAGVALIISFGNRTPLFDVLYNLAPGFRLFRDRERLALIVVWALSVLVAYGGDFILERASPALRRWLPIVALIVVVIDLAANTRSVNWVAPYDPFPAQSSLQAILADAGSASVFRLHNEQRLPGHAACVASLNEVGGITPIHIGSYQQLIQQVPREVRWQLLNVRYVVTWRSVLDDHLGQPVASTLLDQQGEGKEATYTYRLNEENPRAWLVHEVVANPDRTAVLNALAAPDFDPRRVAYVNNSIDVVTNQAIEPVSIVTAHPDRLVVEAAPTTPGLLVLSEINYPGWMATVDGSPASVIEVDGVLRGVALPAGQARVKMTFQPMSLTVGGILTALGIVLWIVLLIWPVRQHEEKS